MSKCPEQTFTGRSPLFFSSRPIPCSNPHITFAKLSARADIGEEKLANRKSLHDDNIILGLSIAAALVGHFSHLPSMVRIQTEKVKTYWGFLSTNEALIGFHDYLRKKRKL